MYRLGWHERNAGNISLLLEKEKLEGYFSPPDIIKPFPLNFNAKELAGEYFLVTGTGKYFKNIES